MAGGENLRIGDAERDEAIVLLREHMSAGRITAEECDERMSAALTAKTRGELAILFNDPGAHPGIRTPHTRPSRFNPSLSSIPRNSRSTSPWR